METPQKDQKVYFWPFLPFPTFFPASSRTALFTIGGLADKTESPLLLIKGNVCANLPALPQHRLAGLLGSLHADGGGGLNDSKAMEEAIIFCGGREDLLQLNKECWRYSPEMHQWVRK